MLQFLFILLAHLEKNSLGEGKEEEGLSPQPSLLALTFGRALLRWLNLFKLEKCGFVCISILLHFKTILTVPDCFEH